MTTGADSCLELFIERVRRVRERGEKTPRVGGWVAETRPAERDDKRPRGARDQRVMREGGAINEFLEGFLPITPSLSLRHEDSDHTSRLLFGTLY